MNKNEFYRFCLSLVPILKSKSPIDTGNLRYNGIRYEFKNESVFEIYVDEAIAPYIFYTNEPWISPKWHGKKNPNEGWWQKSADSLARQVAQMLGGELTK